jgi:lipoate-protein ligase A
MCFTFLSPRAAYDRKANLSIVLGALARFGVQAEASGRNDIVVQRDDGPRKISGSAFRETRDRAFHHGTLLINSDLFRLNDYLTPHPKKLECRGRPSVRSRVMNLLELAPEIDHLSLSRAIIDEFFKFYGAECEIEALDPKRTAGAPGVMEFYEKLASWDWRYGHSPAFKQKMVEKFEWGFVEVHVDTEGARIEGLKIFSDALVPDLIEAFEANLRGRTFTSLGIGDAATSTLSQFPDLAREIDDLASWLKTQVEI